MAADDNAQTGGFLQSLWDDAKGLFSEVVDFEKFKFQANLFNDRQKFEAQLATRSSPRIPRGTIFDDDPAGGTSLINIAIVGGAVAFGVWLLGRVT